MVLIDVLPVVCPDLPQDVKCHGFSRSYEDDISSHGYRYFDFEIDGAKFIRLR
jgi:hypothetical protein